MKHSSASSEWAIIRICPGLIHGAAHDGVAMRNGARQALLAQLNYHVDCTAHWNSLVSYPCHDGTMGDQSKGRDVEYDGFQVGPGLTCGDSRAGP